MLPLGILFGLFGLFGWGISDFLAALNSRRIGNIRTLFWMTLGGLILMILYSLIIRNQFLLSTSAIFVLMLIGIAQAIGDLFFYKALEVGKVSLASPLGSSWSAWTVILSFIILHESVSPLQGLGIVITILGTLLVSTNFTELKKDITKLSSDKGVPLALVASLFWGISWVAYPSVIHQFGWITTAIALRFFLLTSVFVIAFLSKTKLTFKSKSTVVLFLVIMSIVDTIGYFGYSLGLAKDLTSIVSPVAAAFPLVTVLLARIVLKEKVAKNQLIGIGSVLIGIILLAL